MKYAIPNASVQGPRTPVELVKDLTKGIVDLKRVHCTPPSLRDIPMPLVTSGVEHGNLRELALARMADLGTRCRDVRTREVGIQEIHHKVRPYEVGTAQTGRQLSRHSSAYSNVYMYFSLILRLCSSPTNTVVNILMAFLHNRIAQLHESLWQCSAW